MNRVLVLAALGWLLVAGCTTSATLPTGEATAELAASCDGEILTLRLRNTGKTPVVVDRELVFYVQVAAMGAREQPLEWEEVRPRVPQPAGKGFKDRFAPLSPGEQVVRSISLKKGVTNFVCGMGSTLTEHGPLPTAISAYEGVFALAEDQTPWKIVVSYGRDESSMFPECFEHYTGLRPDELGLYEGPLMATVVMRE